MSQKFTLPPPVIRGSNQHHHSTPSPAAEWEILLFRGNRFLVLFGGGTRCQFAEETEQRSRCFLIGEIFQRYRGSEVRRGGVEADADKILVAPGGERIHHRAEFDGPVFFGGQYDWAGAADGPGASAGRIFRRCVFQTSAF